MEGRHVSESCVTISLLMQREHANLAGNVHGGWLMKLIDEAGGICATRHARRPAVTVAVDSLTFLSPVHIGNLVVLESMLTYVGRTSMEVEVHVHAENVLSGERTHTNSAFLVYVTLGDDNRPVPVPPLILQTDDERGRFEQAKKRQALRLARRDAGLD